MAAKTGRKRPRVAVIGAGMAGLAAATELLTHADVVLFETRRYPGGRAGSFAQPQGGQWLDTGQHVLLGCCTEYQRLVDLWGKASWIEFQPRFDLPIWEGGRWATLRSTSLPGSFHLLPSLLGYRHLALPDRLGVLRAVSAIRQTALDRVAEEAFQSWLVRHGQRPIAMAHFWEPITLAILNSSLAEAGALPALRAFKTAVLGDAQAIRVGWLNVPLGNVARAGLEWLGERGVQVCPGQSVQALDPGPSGWRIRARDLSAEVDAVIAAIPPGTLLRLVEPRSGASRWRQDLAAFQPSPILNVYLDYDRPVLPGLWAAFLDSPLQFVFNRGRLLHEPTRDGCSLNVTVSAARAWEAHRPQAVIATMQRALAEALPKAAEARLLEAHVVWQHRATFRQDAASERLRPEARTPLNGLYVAGDWTRTGWPATMEGAVRSGLSAAQSWLRDQTGHAAESRPDA